MSRNKEDSNTYYEDYEIDLREYMRVLWRQKLFIIAFVLIAVVGTYLYTNILLTPEYETSAKIQLANFEGIYSEPSSAEQIFTSTNLMGQVLDELNKELSNAQIRSFINNNINVDHLNTTSILVLEVRYNDPETAYFITENMLEIFLQESEEYFDNMIENREEYIISLENDIKQIEENISENQEIIEESRVANEFQAASFLIEENANLRSERSEIRNNLQEEKIDLLSFYHAEIIDSPYIPDNPVSPNTKLNMAIAAVLALMLAVFVIFFIEFMKED